MAKPETNTIICGSAKEVLKTMPAESVNCCIEVGRTFWKNGDYESVNPGLNDLANNGDHEDNGLACEMLLFEGGKGICLIHKLFGYDVKPDTCKEHQGDKRCKI